MASLNWETERNSLKVLARPERLELPTLGFEDRYSIQLSYGRERPPIARAGCGLKPRGR